MSSRPIVVVGAGISGLTAAYELMKAGREVRLVESSTRVGGCISSDQRGPYLFEAGPNSFQASAQELRSLARDVGIEAEIVESNPAAQTRMIYHRRRLRALPTGPRELLTTKIFSLPQKLRILCERFVPKGPADNLETVARFFYRRFGAAPTRTIVDAFISGVYAGDARKIGLKAAFPMLWEMEQKYSSLLMAMADRAKNGGAPKGLFSFRKGMAQLPLAVAERLGERVSSGTALQRLVRLEDGTFLLSFEKNGEVEEFHADGVVLATPAEITSRLITECAPLASDILVEIENAPIVVVQAGFDDMHLATLPQAFGYLVPRPQRMRTLGWLFSSRTFQGRAPDGRLALTGYVGGVSDPSILDAKDSAIRHLMLGELSLALRMPQIPEPEEFAIVRHTPGIPQYTVGHDKRIHAVRHVIGEIPGLKICGNFLDGISLNDCVKSARRAAHELLTGGPVAAMQEEAT